MRAAPSYLAALFAFAPLALAKDVRLSWNVTWVNAAPDGFERPVIGINNQWPCPQVDVDVGDRLMVEVFNGLRNQTTGIHWHGIHQIMTASMDGGSGTTQCPIEPDAFMAYNFTVDQAGTYWYHAHNMGQYPDGLRGALVVHDPSPPFHFDEEVTITLSDWYHEQMPVLLGEYESKANAKHGAEPLPSSALINDNSHSTIKVKPNKTYLFRFICIGNWPGHGFLIDDHKMIIVEVDGVYTDPYSAGDKKIRLAPGQRVSVLIKTKETATKNYAIWDTMDINMMFTYEHRERPAGFQENGTAWLVYDESAPLPPAPDVHAPLEFVDDVLLTPTDKQPLLEPVDHQVILDMASEEINGVTRYTVNNQTYISQKVPSLYTAVSVGPKYYSNPEVYGQVNPIVVKYGEVVEIVINDHHGNLHPWHLHGHQFQVLQRTAPEGGYFDGIFANVSSTPMRRDTIMVQNHGHTVIRFRADNPDKFLP